MRPYIQKSAAAESQIYTSQLDYVVITIAD